MSNQLAVMNKIESALIMGDLSKLSPDERLKYYQEICHSLGLNALTKPFDYLQLNGKLTLYAKRDATDQLRKIHSVSITITSREKIDDIYIVTARSKDKTGREDESTGAVCVTGLKGDALANAFMKAETKAKRRVTLSACGLGLLDETDVETIPQAEKTVEQVNPIKELKQNQAAKPEDYSVSFGKFKGQKLGDITIHDLASYVEYIQQSALKDGKEIKGQVLEFMTKAGELLSSRGPKEGLFLDEEVPF